MVAEFRQPKGIERRKSELLRTAIPPLFFYDGVNPLQLKELLGKGLKVAGVTTNPTLVSQHPDIAPMIGKERMSKQAALAKYRDIVLELHEILYEANPHYHSISVEPYCGEKTDTQDLLNNAIETIGLFADRPDLQDKLLIKLPATAEGCKVARTLIELGWGVNGTLVFDQESALMWAAATTRAVEKDVKVVMSPFVGRSEKEKFNDKVHNGVDLVRNIRQMYDKAKINHVGILAASIPSVNHMYGVWKDADIVTAPEKTFNEFIEKKQLPLPSDFTYTPTSADIFSQPYNDLLNLGLDLEDYIRLAMQNPMYQNGKHPLAIDGLGKFVNAWDGPKGFVEPEK